MSILDAVRAVLDRANCEDHKTDVAPEDVVEGIAAASWCYCWRPDSGRPPDDCGSYCDTQGVAIGRLRDGAFVVITESSDSTGHG